MRTMIPTSPSEERRTEPPRVPPARRVLLATGAVLCVLAGLWIAGAGAWQLWGFLVAPDLALLFGIGRGLRPGQLHPRAVPLYNVLHSLAGPALLLVAAVWLGTAWAGAGLGWAAHVPFDRSLGYGLRDRSGFVRQVPGGRWSVRRAVGFLVAAMAMAFLGYATLAAGTWYRYGRAADAVAGPGDPLLDRFIPIYEVAERHQARVAAPAPIALAAAKEVDLQNSPINQAIFTVRTLPSRLRGEPPRDAASPGLLEETLALGWGVLAEEPGREVVVGAITQPWEPVVVFHSLPPEQFAAFYEPGYAKIVWTLAAEPLGPDESILRTETRVVTTDPESRERFRRYWSVFSPGIVLIRYEVLRIVKVEAERRAREAVRRDMR